MATTTNQIRSIKNLTALIAYLRDELGWPIETDNIESLTFDYEAEELGLDPSFIAPRATVESIAADEGRSSTLLVPRQRQLLEL